jgi:hypothetical protein
MYFVLYATGLLVLVGHDNYFGFRIRALGK